MRYIEVNINNTKYLFLITIAGKNPEILRSVAVKIFKKNIFLVGISGDFSVILIKTTAISNLMKIRKFMGEIADYFFATKPRQKIGRLIEASNNLNWPDGYKKDFEAEARDNQRMITLSIVPPFLLEIPVLYTTFFCQSAPTYERFDYFSAYIFGAQCLRWLLRGFDDNQVAETAQDLAKRMQGCTGLAKIRLEDILADRD